MKINLRNIPTHIVLIAVSLLSIFPFIWLLSTSLKGAGENIFAYPPTIIPKDFTFANYTGVWHRVDLMRYFINSAIVAGGTVLLNLILSSLAAYPLARMEFKGKKIMFGIVLLQMMIPVQIFIIPQYIMVSNLHWTNSILGLVFPGMVSAFGTFLLRQAFMQLPRDLEDAARLDGCNIPQTFLYIMAPLTKSSLVALSIFTAVFAYKDLMWPMIVCPDNKATTLASALAKMNGQYQQKYPELMMAALISCVPMIILYVMFQKQFIEGIATSGSKQ